MNPIANNNELPEEVAHLRYKRKLEEANHKLVSAVGHEEIAIAIRELNDLLRSRKISPTLFGVPYGMSINKLNNADTNRR